MSNLSKTWCPLPWIHIATRPNGDVRLCATANASGSGVIEIKDAGLVKHNGVQLNLRQHTIEEAWNSSYMKDVRLTMLKGEMPSSCLKCYREESIGINSKRQWETHEWSTRLDYESLVAQTAEDGSLPVNVPYFDLRLGNMCQLKCVMCSPHDSSAWIKDWKKQYPSYKIKELRDDQGWDITWDYTWYKKGDFLSSMKSQAHHIKELYFAGGEPTLIPEHYKILQFMIDSDNAKNCVLRYNSNGIELPDELFDLWHHFKEVKFNLSIDAVYDRNEYIRFPSKWKQIEEAVRRLDDTEDNVTVNIACAVQLLNVLYLDELADWKLQSKFKKINLAPYGGGVIGMHLVTYPSYLNIRVLPMQLKELAADKIRKFIDTHLTEEFTSSVYGKQRWEALITYMMAEDWTHKLPSTVEYLESCDATRGTNFRKTFLELDIL
jgi:MoaA/NifB/PqqE/SkfB family radical SAM enzyme